jgi:hypothetical protein
MSTIATATPLTPAPLATADIAVVAPSYLPPLAREIFVLLALNGPTEITDLSAELRATRKGKGDRRRVDGMAVLSWVFALCDLGLICRDNFNEKWQVIPPSSPADGTVEGIEFAQPLDPTAQQILRFLDREGPTPCRAIALELGIAPSDAYSHLMDLRRRGLAIAARPHVGPSTPLWKAAA